MFEFSLLKSIFFEMDKYKMEGITQTKSGQKTRRRLEVHYPSAPDIFAIAAEERILPYVDRYYLFVNDESVPADIKEPQVKQVIYEFYKEHFPQYLKEGLPDDMANMNILECFEVFNMPDYRPKHAFPGLVKLEDIRNGNIHDDDEPKYAFPGLEFYKDRHNKDGKPMAASYEGYTSFEGDRESAQNKIEEMKKQFSSQLDMLNVEGKLDEILKKEESSTEE